MNRISYIGVIATFLGLCLMQVKGTFANDQHANKTDHPIAAQTSKKAFPRISDVGGVFQIRKAAALDPAQQYNVVLDVTAAAETKDKMHGGLERAARALNLYALANVPKDKVNVVVVVHGKATPIVLSETAYQRHFNTSNPNRELLKRLTAEGVDIQICGQALHHHGFETSAIAPEVTLVLSAMTALVDLQREGFALIPD